MFLAKQHSSFPMPLETEVPKSVNSTQLDSADELHKLKLKGILNENVKNVVLARWTSSASVPFVCRCLSVFLASQMVFVHARATEQIIWIISI